jgi:hypothetical protein
MNKGRTAKPVGRILRLLMGTALTIHATQHMIAGDTTLNLQAAGMVLGLILLYALVHLAISRFAPSINAWLGAVIALAPAILVFALVDPSLRFSVVLFIGASLMVAAIRADGGCEAMTLPGMLMGERTHLVCIVFSPLDWIEDKLTGGTSTENGDFSWRRDERA